MLAIFKREFKAVLRSVSGFTFIALSIFFSGLLFAVINLAMCFPQLEMTFSFLTIPMSVLIPVLGATAFTSEIKNKTDGFLGMLPISNGDIFFGKLLARAAVVAVPTAVMALYPVIIDFYGDANYTSSYLILAMFFLFEFFVLIMSMMFSSMSKNSLVAYFMTFGTLLLTYFIPYITTWTANAVEGAVAETISSVCVFLSPFAQFDYFNVGIFDFRKVIWFCVFIATMAALTYFRLCRKAKKM